MLSGVGRARHLLCLLLFMPLSSNRLQKPALGLAPGTEPSMPPVGWMVQKAFCGQNSQLARECNSCRAAAQSNEDAASGNGALAPQFHVGHAWRAVPEQIR